MSTSNENNFSVRALALCAIVSVLALGLVYVFVESSDNDTYANEDDLELLDELVRADFERDLGEQDETIEELRERIAALEAGNSNEYSAPVIEVEVINEEPQYGFPEDDFSFEEEPTYVYEDEFTGDIYECTDNNGLEECFLVPEGSDPEVPPRDTSCAALRDNPGFETFGYTFLNPTCKEGVATGYYIEAKPYELSIPLWATAGDAPTYKHVTEDDYGLWGAPTEAHPLKSNAITAFDLEVGMEVCVRSEDGFTRDMTVAEFVYIVGSNLSWSHLGINEPGETIEEFDPSLPSAWDIAWMGIVPHPAGTIDEDNAYWSTNWTTAGPC